jgi:hypothetical protein
VRTIFSVPSSAFFAACRGEQAGRVFSVRRYRLACERLRAMADAGGLAR